MITSLLVWACGKIDSVEGSQTIGFSMAMTKADAPAMTDMPAGSSFTVSAKKSAGSTWDASGSKYVFKTDDNLQTVTTGDAGSCSYSPLAYWSSNSVYRFRAVYPIAPDQVNYSDDLDSDAVISNFMVNASAASQKDLMLSELVETDIGATIGTPAPVALQFHHLLCKVKVTINEDITTPNAGLDEFTITGVKLNGLPDRGSYTGTATSGRWDTDGALGLTCVNNTSHTLDEGGAYTDVFDGLLLIPMTISNQVNMVLDYKVRHNDSESPKSVVISIPPIIWEAGKVYTYQLSVSEEYFIKFGKIDVASWGQPQTSGTVIIK